DASLPRIGQEFGGRDHSTVLHAYEKIRARLEQEPELMETVRQLRQRLENPGRCGPPPSFRPLPPCFFGFCRPAVCSRPSSPLGPPAPSGGPSCPSPCPAPPSAPSTAPGSPVEKGGDGLRARCGYAVGDGWNLCTRPARPQTARGARPRPLLTGDSRADPEWIGVP